MLKLSQAPAAASSARCGLPAPPTLSPPTPPPFQVKKWRALLWDGSKQRFLGHYASDQDAARSYDRALVELKGAEAKTNFPMGEYEKDAGGSAPTSADGARGSGSPAVG
eukprot:145812-Chlamydomonas_euryale.AAC.6